MRRARLPLFLIVLGALVGGSACTVHGTAGATYASPRASVELVEVRPGVWVAVDYHRPLFYADGYYWMWRDGTWLRAYSYYGGNWSVVHYSYVPHSLRHLDHHPRYYVRYRAARDRVRYTAPRVRDHRRGAGRPVRVRDHRRDDDRSRARGHRGRDRDDGPRVRDHRDRDDRSRSRSRSKARDRDRDDGPRVRDHRDRGRSDRSRSRSRSRDRERVPSRRGGPR